MICDQEPPRPRPRKSVFDPFFTTKEQGFGMGLSICRSLVEIHGGRMRVDSDGRTGSAFAFTLPVGMDGGGDAR